MITFIETVTYGFLIVIAVAAIIGISQGVYYVVQDIRLHRLYRRLTRR